MKIYIAGKISGLPIGEVLIKFSSAEYRLKMKFKDCEVVNPIRICSQSWNWEKCMKACIAELMKCDAVLLLPDWIDSRGAIIEKNLAEILKLKIL